MITVKSEEEIALMRKAGAITRDVLELIGENAKPGVTTRRLDAIAYDYIKRNHAVPSFLGYGGFPNTICASIDDEIVHGIPGNRVLEEGMLLKIDVGAGLGGFHTDAARTFAIGSVSPEKRKLMDVCRESFFRGIAVLKDGARLGDLGAAIMKFVEANGFSVVRELVGHGIGTTVHEDPSVPNYGIAGRGIRVSKNMTLAIEPMINLGSRKVAQVPGDDWTIVTADGSPSAHYENTVVIGSDGVEIITL
ncbi:MAG TPA: type I methionyl aminopeptidase [Candidatus Stercoripulliclostridium merdipullorum]|uniref:Methionine aminopeptidase n=1 Tax=Candidatus Stercoripulliclostridium merdipullorum TaxID=2840952 RepID=A0A9D1NBD4_9FIRM|nr:type I methionyl aminopeptidase [Candidatus Stercoripulliclostridium merdipullorum]